jgi:hypothetical protein
LNKISNGVKIGFERLKILVPKYDFEVVVSVVVVVVVVVDVVVVVVGFSSLIVFVVERSIALKIENSFT